MDKYDLQLVKACKAEKVKFQDFCDILAERNAIDPSFAHAHKSLIARLLFNIARENERFDVFDNVLYNMTSNNEWMWQVEGLYMEHWDKVIRCLVGCIALTPIKEFDKK